MITMPEPPAPGNINPEGDRWPPPPEPVLAAPAVGGTVDAPPYPPITVPFADPPNTGVVPDVLPPPPPAA